MRESKHVSVETEGSPQDSQNHELKASEVIQELNHSIIRHADTLILTNGKYL